MGSSQNSLFIFCLLAVPFLLFCFGPSSAATEEEKVSLTVYYETLCPFCSYFISHDLIRVFTDGLLPIVRLRLVPWGNAGLNPTGSFQCQQRQSEWQDCFAAASLDPQPVHDCYNNGNGRQIELQYAYETDHLNPPHEYVPWVLVNDQPLEENYKNFVDYLCKAYKGDGIPRVCSSSQGEMYKIEEADAKNKVCYAGTPMNIPSFASTESLP